jgi:hypothetical protein
MDVDTIEPGQDFVMAIEEAVENCNALLVVIDPDWLDARDAEDRRRLDDEHDLVRLEVVAALERGVRVVPVLVQGATMPTAQVLPEPMTVLARRNASVLTNERWDTDIEPLLAALDKIVETAETESRATADQSEDAEPYPLLPAPESKSKQEQAKKRPKSEAASATETTASGDAWRGKLVAEERLYREIKVELESSKHKIAFRRSFVTNTVSVDGEEVVGLWQVASGRQTWDYDFKVKDGTSKRKAMVSVRLREGQAFDKIEGFRVVISGKTVYVEGEWD